MAHGRKVTSLAFLFLLSVLATATFAGPTIRDDFLIVPGQRMGVISLGDSVETVRSKMARAHPNLRAEHASMGVIENLCWSSKGLCAVFVNGSADKVATTMKTYHTRQGVRVGTTYRDAFKRLGKPVDLLQTPYGDSVTWRGMTASVKAGRIIDIAVHAP